MHSVRHAVYAVLLQGISEAHYQPRKRGSKESGYTLYLHDYITEHFKGDCLLVVGDDTLIKIHFHTNEPWKILEYGQSVGDIYDVVVENMQRQEEGLKG